MLQHSWLLRPQACFQALPGRLLLPLPILAVRHDLPQPSLGMSTSEDGSGGEGDLTARERRQLRNERRERKAAVAGRWREDLEDKLMVKSKKKADKDNLNNLSLSAPQWWMLRVARFGGHETADKLAESFIEKYPDREFKVYVPVVKVKQKQKNGTITTEPRMLYPNCIFLYCVLTREIHDFVKGCSGVKGFITTLKGNFVKPTIGPKPLPTEHMEALFKEVEEEQKLADQEFQKDQTEERSNEDESQPSSDSIRKSKTISATKQERKMGKKNNKKNLLGGPESLVPGSSVTVHSGPFSGYMGYLKKMNRKTGKATVGFKLFGEEMFVEFDVNDVIVGE